MATVVKIKNEESILNILFEEKSIVEPSLRRLLDMKNDISVNDLFETNICQILSEKIQRKYDAKSNEGKICRRLLLHFQSLCRKDPGFTESEISLMFLMILMLVLPILHLHQFGPKGKKPKKSVIFEVSSNSDVCPSRLVFEVPVSVPMEDCSIDMDLSIFSLVPTPTPPPQENLEITPPPPYTPTPPSKRRRPAAASSIYLEITPPSPCTPDTSTQKTTTCCCLSCTPSYQERKRKTTRKGKAEGELMDFLCE